MSLWCGVLQSPLYMHLRGLWLVLSLLPHGIFEIPALLISAALGLRLGLEWLLPGAKGIRLKTLKKNVINAFTLLPLILLLLFIAAFAEVFISSRIV